MIPISKPFIGDEEKQAVMAVLESGYLVQGPRTAELERCFAALCGTSQAVATSSGTTALYLALLAHGIGPGDEVITTPFTFIATANSILYTGARPVFVDIEESTFNLDPSLVERAITPRTRAIMPVHLYGQVCDMEPLVEIAGRHGLALVEDAAQAVGATYRGKAAGSFGTGVFSLYATKNAMSAEGGMITTNDEAVAEKCRLLRNHGMRARYQYEMLGFNFRLSDVHAAIGLAQMGRLPAFIAARQANAADYNARLRTVVTPAVAPERSHVWHQYTIRLDGGRDRDAAARRLADAGIGTGIFYPRPIHQHAYIRQIVGSLSLPVAEKAAGEVLSLPVHPQVTPADRDAIVRQVNQL